jgi:predicted MPP superfamily phosphohydrolase
MLMLILINIFIDVYIWKRITKATTRRWCGVAYAWSSLLCMVFGIVVVCLPRRSGSDPLLVDIMWMLYTYFTIYIPKYIYCVLSAFDYLPKLWHRSRTKVGSIVGVVLAVITFVVMWWAAAINRTDYVVNNVDIEVDGLPDAFDGYKILQFSDFHVGTYGTDTTYVSEMVDVMNAQNADAIMFTGDIVNRRTDELLPFVKPLSRLSAPDGVFSILGNHDYGDYSKWRTPRDKQANMELMYALQDSMGWRLLRNEHEFLHRDSDSIAVVGVENWGDPPFTVYGDLGKAYSQLSDSTFKLLLTHNPAHWDKAISDIDSANVALTLSGHTHAMQTEILGWSPAKYRYKEWGGLYSDKSDKHKIYVNIGLGTVAIPARIGATPEITVITLHKKQ